MKSQLLNNVGQKLHKAGFVLKKHSPAILVTAGIVGVVASTVMACKATTKLEGVLELAKNDINDIHADAEANILTKEEEQKALTVKYVQTGAEVAKLYAPAVLVGAVSITSIVASHSILTSRNAAISAAYAIVDRSYKDYRKRVKERFGEQVDFELKNNIKEEVVKEYEVDENGNTKEVEKTVPVMNVAKEKEFSDFARCFGELNPYYQKDAEYNLMFLKSQQAYANDKLKAQGYLFLNEVYDMLGFPKSKAGQVVGWVYDEKNPVGDNFVDFGIYNINKLQCQEFVNGYERAIWLDFNVDGNVLDLMK